MRRWLRGGMGVLLSMSLLCGKLLPLIPAKTVRADTGVVEAWGEGWHYYCIDGFGYASNGVCSNGDRYMKASTQTELNSQERSIIFWSFLSFMSSYLHQAAAAGAVAAINSGASAAGLKTIDKAVTEEDLKAVIHSASVRAKYDWLDFVVAHDQEYLKLAGLVGGGGQTFGGKELPELLKNSTALSMAARAVKEEEGWALEFDQSGKDADFIEKVPLKLSTDGENWQESIQGWNVEKKQTQIRLISSNPEAGVLYLKFDPAGTDYASSAGGYASPDECYVNSLEVWRCVECCGTHFAGGKLHPLAEHQRNVWMELTQVPAVYYAAAGGGRPAQAGGEVSFRIYRHEEDMEADYLVQLYKYDYETGKPLEGAVFDLYERFDDQDQVNRERDGRGEIYEGSMTPSPSVWDGFRLVASLSTDSRGHAQYRGEKTYHYEKTFCDGHPAPVLAEVPEEELDEETGDVLNQDAIDQAEEANSALEEEWGSCVSACEEKAEEGTHFHWLMEEGDAQAEEPGDESETGGTEGADPQTAYEKSGCLADCQKTYDTWISMKYSYTFVETAAREGYGLHGVHRDDVPIEIITTDASQNGANAVFGGGYGRDITGGFFLMDTFPQQQAEEEAGEEPSSLFERAYEEALCSASEGDEVEKGPSDVYSHSSRRDGDEEAWRIYDHRTEGEIHMNKRDLELKSQESGRYVSYGETQGDGTLEGAVYGLFAAGDLIHPDGSTGVVFERNDLVSIGTTDKEGDASFMAITEAPGHTYEYQTGKVVRTKSGWAERAPGNLYAANREIDDYQEDQAYTRSYADNEAENGNCWIGRPLLLGDYYVKELSRSEGYELSVNGRNDKLSNYGYSLDVGIPEGKGSVAVARAPYVEPQSSGRDEDTLPNVVHFAVKSQATGEKGYDMVFPGFPKGSRLYRKDFSQKETELLVPSGEKVKRVLLDELGAPVYQRADADNTYPKRNADGSFVTKDVAVSAEARSMGRAFLQSIDEETVGKVLEEGSEEENKNDLHLDGQDQKQFLYIKMQVETALRDCGYETPGYSTETEGSYNRGVRQGEPDEEGLSGVRPGEAAAETVYGYPVVKVELRGTKENGAKVTVEEAIVTLLEFYEEHPWYGYGGIDGYEKSERGWMISLYAGVVGNPDNYIVLADREEESVIYHRLPWIPKKDTDSPRWVYAAYTNSPDEPAFGSYEDFRSWEVQGVYRCSARLVNDGVVDGDGTIRAKTVKQNVCYEAGEILRDKEGNPLEAYVWEDVMVPATQSQEICGWTELPLEEKKGNLTAHAEGEYMDAFGAKKSDADQAETVYKLVLPQTMVTLTQADVECLPPSYGCQAGETIGAGDYALAVLGAQMFVYLDYEIQTLTGDSLYVKPVSLAYPGQDSYFQDGDRTPGEGTRKNPIEVEERIIRQSAKIVKTVEETTGVSKAVDRFRFKAYLKSNLRRLYRDEEGKIVWVDRKGRETDPHEVLERYPAIVPDFYTKVLHKTDPLYKNPQEAVIANEVLYSVKDGLISETPNSGYTAVLEWKADASDQAAGAYNYEKFFDAILTANQDKWKAAAPSYTSHRPLGNSWNRSEEAQENVEASDHVRQFAINWYLDEEVKKKKQEDNRAEEGNDAAYSDELYDKALREAIKKSEDYLKPFFTYNLDAIYAIPWDSEAEGGTDRDKTTLSADQKEEGQCFGISSYLPYGTYVVVEQQPMYAELGDFKNRHYGTDRPKELVIPSVYESDEDTARVPETMSRLYTYRKEQSAQEQAGNYRIRFQQESHVIKAHSHHGDFEIYKYGMDIGKIANGSDRMAGQGDYFALTQSPYKPYANYYNQEDDRTAGEVPYYLTEGMSAREGISAVYRYSSVSEHSGGTAMTGEATAYDGAYAPMLVPWTIAAVEAENSKLETEAAKESGDRGLAFQSFVDTPYQSRLRIEKLDSQTHENLLHDKAVFRIYKAERDESEYGTGEVKTYEEETLIVGSREFLEGMGAANITKTARSALTVGLLYSGFVPAGTPVCHEKDQVIQQDPDGKKTGDFKAYTTTRDGLMENLAGTGEEYGDQNTGYLETPEELPAGVYVLVEVAPPAGYTRTKPMAVEIYSDATSYYQEGSAESKVLATLYGKMSQDQKVTARVYVENVPIGVRVEKKKKSRDSITYQLSGRIDGSLAQIGGNSSYEYAYRGGSYLGYAWKKGTLEYLQQQKDAGEQVEIVYDGGIFAGYGYITQPLEKEEGIYVPGAWMTLYEGILLHPTGDTEDYGYEGLEIQRSLAGNVTRMYVREGYGGVRTEFLPEEEEDGTLCWNAVKVERPDTDILYYDLGDLDLFAERSVDGTNVVYGYDREHRPVNLKQLEADRKEHSIFAFKGGIPYLELTGGDFTDMSYNKDDHILTLPKEAAVYHLDREGNRDAMVDPHTGMAYIKEGDGTIYVWPVKLTKDSTGRTIASDKIVTSRTATVGENGGSIAEGTQQEEGYLTGTWRQEGGTGSHPMSTIIRNKKEDNLEGEAILHENTGNFEKSLRPILDEHGLVRYYQAGDGVYEKETSLYDRDGDPVRKKQSDLWKGFQKGSYMIQAGGPEAAVHRMGESYLVENTWVTGEETPNDPFAFSMTGGQPDLLKRVPAGIYIMEELKAPPGYVKGLPVGMDIEETGEIQTGEMEDDKTKILFRKLDGTDTYEYEVLDMGLTDSAGTHRVIGRTTEGKGRFSHGMVSGAGLTLCDEKGESVKAWDTKDTPFYLEGLPQGSYTVREDRTPPGFVTCKPVKAEAEGTGEVQVVDIRNDHTKVEVEKYSLDGSQAVALAGVGFVLYEAVLKDNGAAAWENGAPVYDEEKAVHSWETGDKTVYQGFAQAFEEMYRAYGTAGREVSWEVGGKHYEARYVSHRQIDYGGGSTAFPVHGELLFSMTGDKQIRIVVYGQQDHRQGRDFTYEYQFDYQRLPQIGGYGVSYETTEGIRRLDYLPVGRSFVLVEKKPPEGYGKASDRLITVEHTENVQRHRILNQESRLLISKCPQKDAPQEADENVKEMKGASLALYRAGLDGAFIEDEEHLAAQWVSGTDGTYTEYDWINGRIPDGYRQGDRKPHELTRLPDGIYYLTERKSPGYYCRMEPVRIDYSQKEQIRLLRVRNEPVQGELEIVKTDKEGELLEGALFELSAYRESALREPVFTRYFSDSKGRIQISGLPVGEQAEDGSIQAYEYRLKEITPPDGYALDMEIHTFRFRPDDKGVSYAYGQKAKEQLVIANEKTRIAIGKRDFERPEQWVSGARMAVYRAKGRDETGEYRYEEEPVETWMTGKEESHVLEGLVAGQTYALREEEAPEGYERMDPLVFTLAKDGRSVCAFREQIGEILVHSYEQSDAIRSVELRGRYGVKVEMELANQEGEMIAHWTAGGDGQKLRESDGIREGEVYHLTETTVYSDGAREITGQTTRRAHLSEQGVWWIPDRRIERVNVQLADEGGSVIDSWNPSEWISGIEILNPAAPENPAITITAPNPRETVWVEIRCTNTGRVQADMILTVTPGAGSTILHGGGGQVDQGQIRYRLEQMKPGEQRDVRYACQIEAEAKEISVSAACESMGVISQEEKRIPVPQKNQLTIFHEVTGTGKKNENDGSRRFQVFLYTAQGEELKGRYEYEGSRKGSIKSGEILSLAANEYVTIHPGTIYKNIRYEVRCLLEEPMKVQNNVGQAWEDTGACALFSREVPDPSQAMVFQKGRSYEFTESTHYSDKTTRESRKLHLALGDRASVEEIRVMDRKQRVTVQKLGLAGEGALKGAHMQIVREDGSLVEEWVSTEEPYVLRSVLVPGERYFLREAAMPQGYGYAKEIPFRITEGDHASQVVMEDRMTEVDISKKKQAGEEELPGALMQVLNRDGEVVEEWMSAGKPHKLQGRLMAGEIYVLHEKEAPEGYAYGEDVEFTVSREGKTDEVVMRDSPTRVEIGKTDLTGTEALEGAVLQLLDREGKLVKEWISRKTPHQLTGILRAGETYTLHEKEAPNGYARAEDIEFTVSTDGSTDQIVMRDDITRVEIRKTDAATGVSLSGAELELMDQRGQVIERWTSSQEAWKLEGKLKAGETYLLWETSPPAGYSRMEEGIRIRVPENGEMLSVRVENHRRRRVPKDRSPDLTPTPASPPDTPAVKKIGRVYAGYWSDLTAHGRRDTYQTFTNLDLPRMGDDPGVKWAYLVGILGLCLAAAVAGKSKPRKKRFLFFCLCLVFQLCMADTIRADTVEVKPEGRIVVTGEVCAGNEAVPPKLPERYHYKEVEYEQKSSQLVTAMTEGGTKEVEEIVTYESVEQTDSLPETLKVVVTDQRYGTEFTQQFPALKVDFYNWRWIGGFQFPVIVEEADADLYELNGVQIQAGGERLFEGYEEELLNLIQVNPAYYRILEVRWAGEAWTGENGALYREAMATGEKYVADCKVVYGGTAVIEPREGVAWQAIYERVPEESEEAGEGGEEANELQTGEEAPTKQEAEGKPLWYQTSLGQVMISIGLLFLLMPWFLLFLKRRKRRQEKQENSFKT